MSARIQRKRTKGWRMPEGAVNICRPTIYGNPFVVGRIVTCEVDTPNGLESGWLTTTMTYQLACEFYEQLWRSRLEPWPVHSQPPDEYVNERIEWADALERLRGYDLACYCPLDAAWCHGDVLLKFLANGIAL